MDLSISKQDSLVLKGIAICAMFCWHIFFCPNLEEIEFSNFTRFIGSLGDVCVSLFLFVSGYGLAINFSKLKLTEHSSFASTKATLRFVLKRLIKFYFVFSPLCILLVSFGTFVMHVPFQGTLLSFGKEVLGFGSTYDPSWWFNRLIISFYILFPFFYVCEKQFCVPTLLICLLVRAFNVRFLGENGVYSFVFAAGIAWALYSKTISELLSKLEMKIGRRQINFAPLLALLIIICSSIIIWRKAQDSVSHLYCNGLKAYNLLTIGIVLTVSLIKDIFASVRKVLAFLGRHSANVYYMHVLIFCIWFKPFFTKLQNPLLIFSLLMVICICLSIGLEFIKERLGINLLRDKLLEII